MLWEGSRMFLPEHRNALLQQRKDANKLTPPVLDEQQMDAIAYILQEALEYEQPVLATYVTTYEKTCFCGFVDKVNRIEKYIQLSNGSQVQKIPFHLLIDVTWP
jgi:hypothetical protein